MTNGLKILAESLIIRKIQYIVINYINLFVFEDEIEMKNRSTIQTLTFVHTNPQETKIRFYFLDIKKISNFPSNFYHQFLVENCRAGLMIFLHLSCQFILFLYKTQTGYTSPITRLQPNNMIYIISIYIQGFYFLNETSACEMDN